MLGYFQQLQLKTLQTLRSVFQVSSEEVRNPFLHALGPEVVRLAEEAQPVTVVIEALQVLEMVLELTPEAHSKPPNQARLPPPHTVPSPASPQSRTCWVCCCLSSYPAFILPPHQGQLVVNGNHSTTTPSNDCRLLDQSIPLLSRASCRPLRCYDNS